MNTAHSFQNLRATMRHGLWLISALALSVLTACASTGDQVSGAMQVTIKPGEKLRCSSP
jgi:hypothetical protein